MLNLNIGDGNMEEQQKAVIGRVKRKHEKIRINQTSNIITKM
jgi:hypothetical protein